MEKSSNLTRRLTLDSPLYYVFTRIYTDKDLERQTNKDKATEDIERSRKGERYASL